MNTILIIDDDIASCRTLRLHFRSQGYRVQMAHTADDGLSVANNIQPDIIILDIKMPGRSGLEALPDFKKAHPNCAIIMITAFHDMSSTIEAMKNGAEDYIHKPININELDEVINQIITNRQSGNIDISIKDEQSKLTGNNTMIGRSRAMKNIFKTIGLVAPKPVTVLLTGETGTEKELVAKALHHSGPNPAGAFVAVNCAALVETLLESELFGHEKGAFTGASSRQIGKFALANNGTILLDELGGLSLNIQAKLLRVLQEKEYIPIGGRQPQKSNARVIATTNINLQERVKQGLFREDLYYRLQVVSIQLPPLRERQEDLPDLIQALLSRINKDMRHKVTRLSHDVMAALSHYQWPGNVRELENVLMKAVALSTSDIITLDLIPKQITQTATIEASPKIASSHSASLSLEEVEKAHVKAVLEKTGWHRGKACSILGTSRPRLRRIMRQYSLSAPAHLTNEEDE